MNEQEKQIRIIADGGRLFRWIYTVALIAAGVNIWYTIWAAQFEEYDKDLGMVLAAFGLSVIVSLAMVLFRIFKRELSKSVHWPSVIFLITSSPITVGIVVFNYSFFFGPRAG